jgi:hypothetical protein
MITVKPKTTGVITAQADQPIKLRIRDAGLAGVSLRISCANLRLRFDNVHKFDNEVVYPGLPVGEHVLLASIDVMQSPLGSTWDSHWYVNGKEIASTKGDLGKNAKDEGFFKFTLSVVATKVLEPTP